MIPGVFDFLFKSTPPTSSFVTPKVPTLPPIKTHSVPTQSPNTTAATQSITIVPTTSFRSTISPTEEPPAVNNAPVIPGVSTSLAFLLVFSVALFYVLRKK